MQPIQRILVAVKDPKSKHHATLDKAAQLARATGAQLELFHAISTPVYVDALAFANQSPESIERKQHAQYLAQLERIAASMRRRGVKVTTAVEWDFPTYESIVRRAAKIKADLIVVACHTAHRTAWLLRFTDWELLRLSPVPVLLVKSPRPYHRPTVLAAVDPMHTFAKPTRLDAEILRVSTTITTALRGSLHAVHAYVPVPVGISATQLNGPEAIAKIVTQAAKSAQSAFERVVAPAKIPRTRQHLIARHPIDAIHEVARDINSAIVVMGAISRSGLKRLFIGNTAERVLDQLTCDVLVVKPPRFQSHVARAKRGARIGLAAPMTLNY